ncbi:hypothetical protein DNH61_25335 [Paenibacillus sambharensis]|uniref:Zinc chelation protein SecC n=1 Tax=Paenibacillus sambharensis TaxID=1803190 RepID=A0A2W1LFB0_9BACL|nr:SEC-C metal-binding domain-containing protein [Paenibacillus sambharensis]PZD93104.1 hypothetical protein DNH61_25335 [Paenibacillus sambharensis]
MAVQGQTDKKKELERMIAKRKKEEAALWTAISYPLGLTEALGRLTKDDLTRVRTSLQLKVKGVSTLKKQELCEAIAAQMPEGLERVWHSLDESKYNLLKAAERKNGKLEQPDLIYEQIVYFRSLGLLFPGVVDGVNTLVMPEEVLESFRRADTAGLKASVQRNTELAKLTRGILYYNGVLTWDELAKLIPLYTEEALDTERYRQVIEDAASYDASVQVQDELVAHADVTDIAGVRTEQGLRQDAGFYPLTKKQVVQAADPDYIDRTPQFQALVHYFMHHYELSRADAEDTVDMLAYSIKLGDPLTEIMQDIERDFELGDELAVRQLIDLLMKLMNNTRLWFLKGYTPLELNPQPEAKPVPAGQAQGAASGAAAGAAAGGKVIQLDERRKIGRNEPCPCGSGVKYKKCCGKS